MERKQDANSLNDVCINGSVSFRITNDKMKGLLSYLARSSSAKFSAEDTSDEPELLPVISVLSDLVLHTFTDVISMSHALDDATEKYVMQFIIKRSDAFSREHFEFCRRIAEDYEPDLFVGIVLQFVLMG